MSRDLVLLALALLTWGIGEGMFLNFQPLYLETLGADPRLIGGILGGVGLAMAIVHLPAGYLSDRIGRRPLLYTAWFMGTAATWIMALANTLPLFIIGSILYGLTNFVLVPLNSYVTAARGSWSVGRAITLISAAFNSGAVLGPLVGGWVGEKLGMDRAFFVAAVFFVASTLLVLFIKAQPIESGSKNISFRTVREVLHPRFTRYLVMIFVVMFVLYIPQPLSQNFIQNEKGLSLTQIGQLLSVTSIGVVILNLLLGQMNARLGFLLSQVAMGIYALLLWQGQSSWMFFTAYFLLGSYRTARSLAAAQSRSLVNSQNMGIAYGWVETIASITIVFAPPIAGWLYSLQPQLVYPVSLALICVAILFTIRYTPIKSEEIL